MYDTGRFRLGVIYLAFAAFSRAALTSGIKLSPHSSTLGPLISTVLISDVHDPLVISISDLVTPRVHDRKSQWKAQNLQSDFAHLAQWLLNTFLERSRISQAFAARPHSKFDCVCAYTFDTVDRVLSPSVPQQTH